MQIRIREYRQQDIAQMIAIWNQVVEDGIAFPQMSGLDMEQGRVFFGEQTYNGVAEDVDTGTICGLYILHPNNIGRCGHICNASYAVDRNIRSRGIGEKLVRDSLEQGKRLGFHIMQFNAVVASNTRARGLYERLGFVQLGVIPKGFLMKDGHYEDICPYYYVL